MYCNDITKLYTQLIVRESREVRVNSMNIHVWDYILLKCNKHHIIEQDLYC